MFRFALLLCLLISAFSIKVSHEHDNLSPFMILPTDYTKFDLSEVKQWDGTLKYYSPEGQVGIVTVDGRNYPVDNIRGRPLTDGEQGQLPGGIKVKVHTYGSWDGLQVLYIVVP